MLANPFQIGPSIRFDAEVAGCMDENNLDYDPNATVHDGSRCGGCIEGWTRNADPSMKCNPINKKMVDCKTGTTYWFYDTGYKRASGERRGGSQIDYRGIHYQPSVGQPGCCVSHTGRCHMTSARAIRDDGVPMRGSWCDKKAKTPSADEVWSQVAADIKDKCGETTRTDVLPSEVPPFLGPSTSTTGSIELGQQPIQPLGSQIEPVVEPPSKLPIIAAGAIIVGIIAIKMKQRRKKESIA